MSDAAHLRRRYAEQIATRARLRSEALLEAFASVHREDYLGPGRGDFET